MSEWRRYSHYLQIHKRKYCIYLVWSVLPAVQLVSVNILLGGKVTRNEEEKNFLMGPLIIHKSKVRQSEEFKFKAVTPCL